MENQTWYVLIAAAVIAVILIRRYMSTRSVTQYTPQDLPADPAKKSTVLLDVRTTEERREGFIPGSLHIPLHEINGRLKELERYREKEIICYCRSGSRSMSAAVILGKAGFKSANLKGGITEWNYYRLRQEK